MSRFIGIVSAYAYAVSQGYTGTEEEYAELMASYATVAEEAAESAESASASATSASASASTATTKASEASQSATQAGTKASQASTSATQASASATSASQSAQTATTKASEASVSASTASTKAGEASTSATTASNKASEASASATSAQTAQGLAESARDDAIDAKTDAETARDLAQQYAESIDPENIFSAYPTDTASGAVATFPDGADDIPLKSCIVQIEPVQAGSGDPSPDNVRPISGWTGAQVTRTGVNLFDKTTAVIGYVDENDGVLKLTESNYRSTDFIKVLGGQSYYIKTEQTNAVWGAWYDENKAYISGQTGYDNKVITAPNNAKYIRLTVASNAGGNVDTFSINYPASDYDYHPYGNTYSITFPAEAGTVYRGTLDVINGVLTVDMVEVDLGTLTWSYSANYDWFTASDLKSTIKKPPTASYTANAICSKYPITRQALNNSKKGLAVWTDGTLSYWNNSEFSTDATIFKTAMAGIQLVYEPATPQTYQLTPTEIRSLLGTNNVFADTGDSTVEYREDTTMYINRKIAEAVSALS